MFFADNNMVDFSMILTLVQNLGWDRNAEEESMVEAFAGMLFGCTLNYLPSNVRLLPPDPSVSTTETKQYVEAMSQMFCEAILYSINLKIRYYVKATISEVIFFYENRYVLV